jgi:hypothetical protein
MGTRINEREDYQAVMKPAMKKASRLGRYREADPTAHFSSDGWKLAALLVCKGAGILSALAALVLSLHGAGIV